MRTNLICKLAVAASLSFAGVALAKTTSVAPPKKAPIPSTIVVKKNLKTGQTSVLNVGKPIPANKKLLGKLKSAPFQAVTVDGQLTGKLPGKEKDIISSKSAWYLGFGSGNYTPQHGYGHGGHHHHRPHNSYRWTNPSFYYGSHAYSYRPYYSYTSAGYSYSYCKPTYAYSCNTNYQNCGSAYTYPADYWATSGNNYYWSW